MLDKKCLLSLIPLICGPALADDTVHIDDLLPSQGEGRFFADALYPHMDLTLPDGAAAAVIPPGGVPEEVLVTPRFGLTEQETPNGTYADGIFYSPADGVELNAKTGVRDGFLGTLGFTIRF